MLCISIAPKPGPEGRGLIKEACDMGDMVELRLDKMSQWLVPFHCSKPFLFTYRTTDQGGEGRDVERAGKFLWKVVGLGGYVDVEFCWDESIKRPFRKYWGKKVIYSHHELTRTPSLEELRDLYDEMTSTRPYATKIVTFARSVEDNLTIKRFLCGLRGSEQRVISFAMGEMGILSRVLCLSWGSYMTFGSLKGDATAEGQIDGAVLLELSGGLYG